MGGILKFLALGLIAGGLAIIFMIYSPIIRQEMRYRTLQTQSHSQVESEIIPQSIDFGLVIAKIGVNTKVFKQVDPNNPAEYLPLLAQGVAQAVGSVFPGQEGTVFLFAHSADSPLNVTRYNAVFYLLNKLAAGDEIEIYYHGLKHVYRVTDKKIIAPELVGEYWAYEEERRLVLQTCHPPGTTVNRLLIIAEEN